MSFGALAKLKMLHEEHYEKVLILAVFSTSEACNGPPVSIWHASAARMGSTDWTASLDVGLARSAGLRST